MKKQNRIIWVNESALRTCQKVKSIIKARFHIKEEPKKKEVYSVAFLFPFSAREFKHRYYRGFFFAA